MRDVALLSFAGRRSGRRYAIPVSWHELAGTGVVLTASGWKANFRGGRDVDVLYGGGTRPMRGELVEAPDTVAETYLAILRRVGVRRSRLIGLELAGRRMPTRDEVLAATRGRRAVVRFTPR
jgi:hypothetical protein